MHFTRLAGTSYPDRILAVRLREQSFPHATHLAPNNVRAAVRIAPDLVASHFGKRDEEQRILLARMLSETWNYDGAVLGALADLPRRPFVRPTSRIIANWTGVHVVAGSNAIESAWLIAFIATEMRIEPSMRILVLGSGAGYGLALLAAIVGPGGQATGVELDDGVRRRAAIHLEETALYPNIVLMPGDALAWQSPDRYDAIWATLSAPRIPAAWTDFLSPVGRLLAYLPANGHEEDSHCSPVNLVAVERDGAAFTRRVLMEGLVNAPFSAGMPSNRNPFQGFADLEDRIAAEVQELVAP